MTFTNRIIKAYILNDTSREKYHAGCLLVMKNLQTLCKKYGIEILFSDTALPDKNIDIIQFKKDIQKCDLLLFNGEGTLHHSRAINFFKKCEIAKEMGKKVILLNTVWQDNQNTEDYLELFDLISVRESLSLQQLPEKFLYKSNVVPDLTFYNQINTSHNETGKILFTDSVNIKKTELLEKLAHNYKQPLYLMYPHNQKIIHSLNFFEEKLLTNASHIITGRFHVLTMGMKYEIPTLAFQSNTHKINGLLKDANLEGYIVNESNCIEQQIQTFLLQNNKNFVIKSQEYSRRATVLIESYFEKIINLI